MLAWTTVIAEIAPLVVILFPIPQIPGGSLTLTVKDCPTGFGRFYSGQIALDNGPSPGRTVRRLAVSETAPIMYIAKREKIHISGVGRTLCQNLYKSHKIYLVVKSY